MQIIPLMATPSQTLTANLANQPSTIDVITKSTGLFVDLYVNSHPKLAIFLPFPWSVDLGKAAGWVASAYQPNGRENRNALEYELRMFDNPFNMTRCAPRSRVSRPSIWRLVRFVKIIQKDAYFWQNPENNRGAIPVYVENPGYDVWNDDVAISPFGSSGRRSGLAIPDKKFIELLKNAHYRRIMLRRMNARENAVDLVEQWRLFDRDNPPDYAVLTDDALVVMDREIDRLRQERDEFRKIFYMGTEEPSRRR